MEENIVKLSVIMDLLNKEIAKINTRLSVSPDEQQDNYLNYLLTLKQSIYSGDLSGIDEFLKKYKENNLDG